MKNPAGRMIPYFGALTLALVLVSPKVAASAECTDKSAEQCALAKTVDDLQKRLTILEQQSREGALNRIEFYTIAGEAGGGPRSIGCPTGHKLVGGSCFPTGGDFSRPQFGPRFEADGGTLSRVICQRYGNEPVQAIAICAKPK
jgi:hypothetical protein